MKNYPDIKILDAKHGNWNRDDAFKVMQDYLTRFKHIDAVWTGDDDMSVGVLKAIDQASVMTSRSSSVAQVPRL